MSISPRPQGGSLLLAVSVLFLSNGLQAVLAFSPILRSAVGHDKIQSFVVQESRWSTLSPLFAGSIDGSKIVNPDHDILLRVARGEQTHRTPVWLMRQAGRYMAAFREYSEKYPFRQRSETPSMAIELSMQPLEAFGVDGVIMFSDILTPLPALGIEFDVISGKGPVIPNRIATAVDVDNVRRLDDPASSLPFVGETLRTLKNEVAGRATLLGFVGAPFTLAAYTIEGGSSKNCLKTKRMMMYDPTLLHVYLDKLATAIGDYACYQIENGAEVIQVFESWAHQLSPSQFLKYSKPYADKVTTIVKERHPEVPIIFFGHGASSFLELQGDMAADMICLDWQVDMATARRTLGAKPVSGNVDPTVLLGPPEGIVAAVDECVRKAGGGGHILNLGHGVIKTTPEDAVRLFVDTAKSIELKAASRESGSDGPPPSSLVRPALAGAGA